MRLVFSRIRIIWIWAVHFLPTQVFSQGASAPKDLFLIDIADLIRPIPFHTLQRACDVSDAFAADNILAL
jgi:hypothetical protein